MGTGFDQSDSALSRWDPLHVSMRGDAHGCSHCFSAGFQHLHGPHSLFHMVNELQVKTVRCSVDARLKGKETCQISTVSAFAFIAQRYLHNEEINVLLEEIVHLFLKDGLDLSLVATVHIAGSF